jgi:hypothetical protein
MADFADLYRKQMIRDAMADPRESPMMRDVVQAQFQTPNALGPAAAFMGSMANVKRGGQNRFGSLEQLYAADQMRTQKETAQDDQLLMEAANEIADFVMQNPDMPKDQLNANISKMTVSKLGTKAKEYFPSLFKAAGPAKEPKGKEKKTSLFDDLDSDKGGATSEKKGDEYEIGAIYKDAQGRKAEYMGRGKWRMTGS